MEILLKLFLGFIFDLYVSYRKQYFVLHIILSFYLCTCIDYLSIYYFFFNIRDILQALKWNFEWAEPQRIIQKRALIFPKHLDKECMDAVSELDCQEWFVKWKGLGYDQCTWEL